MEITVLILFDLSQDNLFETFMISRRCNLHVMLQFQFGAKCTMLSMLTHPCHLQRMGPCESRVAFTFIFLLLCTLIGKSCNAKKIYTYNVFD